MPDWTRRLWAETVRDFSALGSFPILFLFGLGLYSLNLSLGARVLWGLCVVDLLAALVKLAVHRPRPDGQTFANLIGRIDAGSLPSVHAARSLFMAVTVSGWYPLLLPVALPACLLVGTSRVLLRRHRVTDVIAGYVLGAAVSLILSPVPLQSVLIPFD